MLAKQQYADGGIISPGHGWEYKREGEKYLTRKTDGNQEWITAKGTPLAHIKAKIYKESDAISGLQVRSKVSPGTQSQETGAVQVAATKKEEKVKSSQLLRTGHGDWQQTAQEFLLSQGEYLGLTGPRGKGVDGDWGPTSQAALDNYKKRIDPWALPVVTKAAYGEEECSEWQCSKLASAKASGFVKLIKGDNEATTWAQNAWFDKSHQLNTGGQLLYNEPKRGDMGYVPKELYDIFQVGDFVHMNRAGQTYDKEYKVGLENEKIEHMGMIIGKDERGVPLVYHGSEKGKAYIQPIDKALDLPDQGRFGFKYWISSIVRPKELIGEDFSPLKDSRYHRPSIEVDKENQLVALPGASEYQKQAMSIVNKNYKALGQLGYTQNDINLAGEVLLGGILNMESKAMDDSERMNVSIPVSGGIIKTSVPHPYKNPTAYGVFIKGKETLASFYKHPVFKGMFTDESRINVFGKNIPAPGIGEVSKSPYQFKPKMHFGTNMRPTPLGKNLYHNLGILPEDVADNAETQVLAAMAILLNNMSSIKRREKYDEKTNTYDEIPISYVLAKSWQAGSGFVGKEKYQDLLEDLDITYSNVALEKGREDITSGKGSAINQKIYASIDEKEAARTDEAIKKFKEYISSQLSDIQREYLSSRYTDVAAESTNVVSDRRNYTLRDTKSTGGTSEFVSRFFANYEEGGRISEKEVPISAEGKLPISREVGNNVLRYREEVNNFHQELVNTYGERDFETTSGYSSEEASKLSGYSGYKDAFAYLEEQNPNLDTTGLFGTKEEEDVDPFIGPLHFGYRGLNYPEWGQAISKKFKKGGNLSTYQRSEEEIPIYAGKKKLGYAPKGMTILAAGDPLVEEIKGKYKSFKDGGPISAKDVHDAADRAGIKWDNDPGFMERSKELVNEEHIDKMTSSKRRKLINSFQDGGPVLSGNDKKDLIDIQNRFVYYDDPIKYELAKKGLEDSTFSYNIYMEKVKAYERMGYRVEPSETSTFNKDDQAGYKSYMQSMKKEPEMYGLENEETAKLVEKEVETNIRTGIQPTGAEHWYNFSNLFPWKDNPSHIKVAKYKKPTSLPVKSVLEQFGGDSLPNYIMHKAQYERDFPHPQIPYDELANQPTKGETEGQRSGFDPHPESVVGAGGLRAYDIGRLGYYYKLFPDGDGGTMRRAKIHEKPKGTKPKSAEIKKGPISYKDAYKNVDKKKYPTLESFEKAAKGYKEKKKGIKPKNTEVKFNPEGGGYDMESALAAGLKPDESGHWSSRNPKTGLLLKGKGHSTWDKTLKGEKEVGYVITKGKDGRYYSHPKKGSIQHRTKRTPGSQYIKYINDRGDTKMITKTLYDTEKKYNQANVLETIK